MTSLRFHGRCPRDTLTFFRVHRDYLGPISHATVTVAASASQSLYTVMLGNDAGGLMLLSGPVADDEDEVRSVLLRVAVEAGFAEQVACAIRTHAVVRVRRCPDGATVLECASSPRRQSPQRLPTEPARAALRAFARGHGIRLADLPDVLTVDASLVNSSMSAPWLAWEAADRLAIALRTHPSELWPNWFGQRNEAQAAEAAIAGAGLTRASATNGLREAGQSHVASVPTLLSEKRDGTTRPPDSGHPCRWFSSAPIRQMVEDRRLAGEGLNVVAKQAGVTRRWLQRVIAAERLRSDAADALAVALGHHPCELWPEWFEGEAR